MGDLFGGPGRKGKRKKSRYELGLGEKCACNLVGNTTGVCPECGTPVVPPEKPAGPTPR